MCRNRSTWNSGLSGWMVHLAKMDWYLRSLAYEINFWIFRLYHLWVLIFVRARAFLDELKPPQWISHKTRHYKALSSHEYYTDCLFILDIIWQVPNEIWRYETIHRCGVVLRCAYNEGPCNRTRFVLNMLQLSQTEDFNWMFSYCWTRHWQTFA